MFELVDIPRAGIIGLVDLGPGHVLTPTYHRVRRNGRDLGGPERHEACGGVGKTIKAAQPLAKLACAVSELLMSDGAALVCCG